MKYQSVEQVFLKDHQLLGSDELLHPVCYKYWLGIEQKSTSNRTWVDAI